jgi:hypothetical protein
MNLPRMARQHLLGLKARVHSGNLTADAAGEKFAKHLKDKYPTLVDALLVRWCTAKFGKAIPLPEGWVQADLLPPRFWSRPLSEAIEHHKERVGMTGRFAERNDMLGAELELLTNAAGGDTTVTVEEAYRLAHPAEETG